MNETFESVGQRPDDCETHLPASGEAEPPRTDDRIQTETLGLRSRRLIGVRFISGRFARHAALFMLALTSFWAAGCGSSGDEVVSPGQVATSWDGTPVVVAGGRFSCAIGSGKSLECWGRVGSDMPTGEFSAITIGGGRPCAIRTDGTLACWVQSEGRHMPPAGEFMAVASANIHSCALRTDGSVACWGDTRGGEGLPQGEYTAIVAAGERTCGIQPDSTVVCQGDQHFVTTMPGEFTAIDIDGRDLCGLRSDRTISCYTMWNVEPSEFTPPSGEFLAVSLGNGYGCAIRAQDKSVECWTWAEWGNEHGQAAPPAGEFVSISSASYHVCGVRANKKIVCWGDNEHGQAAPPLTLSG